MPPPHNPHDSLVKRIFSNPEAAAAELRQVLPAELVSGLDWSTLRLQSGTFVDPALQHRHSDLLYSVDLREGPAIAVYVLLEHQSTVDPRMAVRFVAYIGRIYERLLREQPAARTVPMVVPVLLFQGKTGWSAPRRLSDCLQMPASLRRGFSPPVELRFDVDDLSRSALEQLSESSLQRDRGLVLAEMARTLLWLCRHPDAHDGERALLLAPLLDAVAQTWGVRATEPFFVYLLSTFEHDTPIRDMMLKSTRPETRQMFVTIRDKLIAQGHQAGVVEGRAAGREEGRATGREEGQIAGRVRTLIQLFEARGVELTAEQRQRIERCGDEAVLERWFGRAVTADSAAEVFSD